MYLSANSHLDRNRRLSNRTRCAAATSHSKRHHVQQQSSKASICLRASWQNLTGWKYEPITSGISQFNGEGILGFGDIIYIIDRSSSRLVDG